MMPHCGRQVDVCDIIRVFYLYILSYGSQSLNMCFFSETTCCCCESQEPDLTDQIQVPIELLPLAVHRYLYVSW